jgi:type IV secretion system protein TrbF
MKRWKALKKYFILCFYKKSGTNISQDHNTTTVASTKTNSTGIDNPYLCARRTWNTLLGVQVATRQMWQIVGVLALLIALVSIAGLIHIGSQSKFIPYVIEVDKLGQTVAISAVTASTRVDPRVIRAAVSDFVSDARLVSPDVALQRKAIFRVYAKLSPNDPATTEMNTWLNGYEDASPFQRAKKEMVSVAIQSVMAQTPDTWQVDWLETTRDRQGVLKGSPIRMRALITVYVLPPNHKTTEEQLRDNPLGIYVRHFSWSRLV